jgi:hypothetical protein
MGEVMYTKDLAEQTLAENPGWEKVAYPMYEKLHTGIISRCLIRSTPDVIGARIDLIHVETTFGNGVPILLRLQGSIVINVENSEVVQLASALFIDGPEWSDSWANVFQDVRIQLGMYLQEWKSTTFHPWRDPADAFAPHRAFMYREHRQRAIRQELPVHTQPVLSYYGLCFGEFTGSLSEKRKLIGRTTPNEPHRAQREGALRAFGKRFGTFVGRMKVQAHREQLGTIVSWD